MIAIMVCEDCDQQMVEVFNASENRMKGWMCEGCLEFVPAIGRERNWKMDDRERENGDKAGRVRQAL